jgi:hypothetical protein
MNVPFRCEALSAKATVPWRIDCSILKVMVMLFGLEKLVLEKQN